jgi:hypothetical protein
MSILYKKDNKLLLVPLQVLKVRNFLGQILALKHNRNNRNNKK